MYIVVLDEHPGYFGPFDTRDEGQTYIEASGGEGRVVALIKPFSFDIRIE